MRLSAATGRLCEAADLALLFGLFLCIEIMPTLAAHSQDSGRLNTLVLALRILLVTVLSLTLWRLSLWGAGAYSRRNDRSLIDYALRCILGLNLCVLFVAISAAALATWRQVWPSVELFWGAGLFGMLSIRLILLGFDRILRSLVPARPSSATAGHTHVLPFKPRTG